MVNFKTRIVFSGLILFLCFIVAEKTLAISIPSTIPELEQQISIDVSSQFPQPQEKVKITLSAYGTNLNLADVTWKVDGVTSQTGKGITTFEIQAGKAGQAKKIDLTVVPVDGGIIKKSITISPQDLDLIWESRTYTPPFYKGKAMFSPQEKIFVVAIPNFISSGGAQISRSSLVYNWKKDYSAVANQSGYGKNIFSATGSILMKPVSIAVEVTGPSSERAKKETVPPQTLPLVLLYEKSPLYGVLFNSAVYGNYDFGTSEEKTFEAFPFFFGVNKKSGPYLTYDWNIVGDKINLPKNQSYVTLRNTDKRSGNSSIGVKISSGSNFLQEARQSVSLIFSSPDQSFGI